MKFVLCFWSRTLQSLFSLAEQEELVRHLFGVFLPGYLAQLYGSLEVLLFFYNFDSV